MELPSRLDLPFFAYGLFRPGQLGFLRVRAYVIDAKPSSVRGDLRIRDGLPIADGSGQGLIHGSVLVFAPGLGLAPYERIVEIEPGSQYVWGSAFADDTECNILWGRSPTKGSIPLEEPDWDGRDDPLFTTALEVVEEALAANSQFAWDLRPMFRLQMAYLLLWSSIERYTSLRYHLGDKAFDKVKQLAGEAEFVRAMKSLTVAGDRSVQRADRPTDRIRFDPGNPARCIEYYYQLRSNIVHRGKGVVRDHDRIREALTELLPAFKKTLEEAFGSASLDA